jgi:hypothetical protein
MHNQNQDQSWELVDGLWKETTRGQETARLSASTLIQRLGKVVLAPTAYLPEVRDEDLHLLACKPEGCCITYAPFDVPLWLKHYHSGDTEQATRTDMDAWLRDNCTTYPRHLITCLTPTQRRVDTYALAVRVNQETLADYGPDVIKAAALFLSHCCKYTLRALVKQQNPGAVLYWRAFPAIESCTSPDFAYDYQSIAIRMRLAFDRMATEEDEQWYAECIRGRSV